MSPTRQIRGALNTDTGNERSSEFNIDDASDSNIKWTSTPLKRPGSELLRRRLSTPTAFDSEESTDLRSSTRPLPRRRSAKGLRKETGTGLKRIESANRREKRRGKSKRRRSEGNAEGEDSTLAVRRSRGGGNRASEKRRRDSKNSQVSRQEGDFTELPIAELLRKAQESHKNSQLHQQTKYEDSVPLPELTTNTVYVQGRNGFSAVKIGNQRSLRSGNEKLSKPINVAIRMHNLSKSVMLFCHGLLGGIALSQVVLVSKICSESTVSEKIYASNYPSIMSGIFLFLNTLCLLSTMDRIDFAHLDLEHIREITCHRCMLLVTFPLYLAAISIHLTLINGDDKITCDSREFKEFQNLSGGYIAQREMHVWKFALSLAAWICIALGPTDDMTAAHLEAMQKYAR